MRSFSITFFLSVLIVSPASVSQSKDSLFVERISDCCFSLTLKNANEQGRAIHRLELKTVPSIRILANASAPPGWTVQYLDTLHVGFETAPPGISPGLSQAGFTVCFNSTPGYFEIAWRTEDRNGAVTGSLTRVACAEIVGICDSVSAVKDPARCCYSWTFRNLNETREEINRIELDILTPNSEWSGWTQTPPLWLALPQSGTKFSLVAQVSGIEPDSILTGFLTCLQPTIGSPDTVRVRWSTWNDSTLICRDTLSVTCEESAQCDSVSFQMDPAEGCCHEMTLFNRNSIDLDLDGFSLEIRSPGITFRQTPSGPWSIRKESPVDVLFVATLGSLDPGKDLGGFRFCFNNPGGSSNPIKLAWRSHNRGSTICNDSLLVYCADDATSCDTVVVQDETSNPVAGACCYSLTMFNNHTPAGVLNGLGLKILSPGVIFAGIPSAPWTASAISATEMEFETSTAPLASGSSLGVFSVCIEKSNPVPGPVLLVWTTLFDGSAVCSDTMNFQCSPYLPCDSIFINKLQDCEYDAGFRNTHWPASTVSGFRVTVLDPAGRVTSTGQPSGWSASSPTQQQIEYASTGGTAAGQILSGFRMRFDPPSPSTAIPVQLCTLSGDSVLCCDTVAVVCTPVKSTCDSLITSRLDPCQYEFTLLNAHQPSGPVNDFHVSVLTAGAGLVSAEAPPGWMIDQFSSTQVSYRDTSGGLPPDSTQPGFLLRFEAAPGDPNIVLHWCSTVDTKEICCNTLNVQCDPPDLPCDSLLIGPSPSECTFELGFLNRHAPVSLLDRFIIQLRTPEAQIRTSSPPANWSVQSATQDRIIFRHDRGGIRPDSIANGFLVSFIPSSVSSQILIEWCTSIAGQEVCCDSVIVECKIPDQPCDFVELTTELMNGCCTSLRVYNLHEPVGLIDGLRTDVITPGVTLLETGIGDPSNWGHTRLPTWIKWLPTSGGIPSGGSVSGFRICYSREPGAGDTIGLAWETTFNRQVLCNDTIYFSCGGTSAVSEIPGPLPSRFELQQNYPNPFNPSTNIVFRVPYREVIELAVFDTHGKKIEVLKDGISEAGTYQVRFDGSRLPSGVYFYRLKSAGYARIRPMMLMK